MSDLKLEYRYKLKRENISDGHYGILLYIMLNPSTANDDVDDRTIESCTRLAINNSYHSFWVGNLYGIRVTDPSDFMGLAATTAKGEGNNQALMEMIGLADDIVVAWGNPGGRNGTIDIRRLLGNIDNLLCIKTNKNGTPAHPLYKKANTKFKPWSFK